MTQKVDFASLSLKDALDFAILVEEEAQERYEEFVGQMELHHTPEAAAFFRLMAGNEAKHGEALAAQRRELFGDAPRQVTRAMLWDVEAPDYDEARAFMSAHQALETALRAEIKAHDFFVKALSSVTEPDVRALFEQLRDEEVEHQSLVRGALAKLPPAPGFDPDDFADDPVAH